MLGVILWTYVLAFWFRAEQRYDGVINPLTCEPREAGDIFSTFFAVLTGSCFVGQISLEISRYAGARCSGARFSAVLRHEGAIQGSLKDIPSYSVRFVTAFACLSLLYDDDTLSPTACQKSACQLHKGSWQPT